MRTIRFRGKRLLDNKFVYGSLVQCLDGSVGIFNGDDFEHNKIVAVKKSTVGQFTGLQDAEGTDIYEGDLLLSEENAEVFEVVYDAPRFCFKDNVFGFRFLNHPEFFHVIGNIHDNHELLEEKS